jgi:hypothetical protein
MGYYMNQRDSNFCIKRENVGAAHDALKTLMTAEWGDVKIIKKSRTLAEAFEELGWRLEMDDDGDVIDIHFEGKKAGGDETVYFDLVAPYVDKGSFGDYEAREGDEDNF